MCVLLCGGGGGSGGDGGDGGGGGGGGGGETTANADAHARIGRHTRTGYLGRTRVHEEGRTVTAGTSPSS